MMLTIILALMVLCVYAILVAIAAPIMARKILAALAKNKGGDR